MRLEAFLTDLLYDHDCVIIPGFGGLVANYRPARLNKITHVVRPPSKHVGFNRNLTHNDGLLVAHIARITGRAYDSVLKEVEEEVAGYQQLLIGGERVAWQSIGLIFRDRSGSLQFVPEEQENFLLDAFGLVPVQLRALAPAVKTEENIPAVASGAFRRTWIRAAAAVAIPLLAAGTWLWFNHTSGHNGYERAVINPLTIFQRPAAYSPVFIRPELQPWDTTQVVGWESLLQQKGVRVNLVTGEEDARGIEIAEPKSKARISARQKSTSTRADVKVKYVIIAGAFEQPDNAERLINQLESEGVRAFRAGMRGRLHLVGVASAESEREARRSITEMREAGRKSVWLLKR